MNEPWWIAAIKAVVIINLLLLTFAYMTLVERKLIGRMQRRYGPNRAGPFGLLQPIADLVKLIRKEAFYPQTAIGSLYIAAPALSRRHRARGLRRDPVRERLAGRRLLHRRPGREPLDRPDPALRARLGRDLRLHRRRLGLGLRSTRCSARCATCAQLVSYEVSLALSVLGVVLMAGSLSLVDIVHQQESTWWYAVPQFIGLLVFFVAGIAETNRAPFDLPEAETELVAGYLTEYSGMRFGLFSMAEYINMIVLSALCVTLFFGGWLGPVDTLGPLWFVLKLFVVIFIFIWLRTTVPRLRYDQLMALGWKVLLPVATINALVTAALVVAI